MICELLIKDLITNYAATFKALNGDILVSATSLGESLKPQASNKTSKLTYLIISWLQALFTLLNLARSLMFKRGSSTMVVMPR